MPDRPPTPGGPTPPGLTRLTTQGKKSFGAGEQYELDEVLGEGSYGSVYKCHRTRDNAVYAVKIIDPMRLGFVGGSHAIRCAESMALREVNALRKLAIHAGIISLEAAFWSPATQQIFIVTDFLPGSHLFSHVVQRSSPLQEEEVSHIMAQVADAMEFCHSLGVVHRDLKLENVLVAKVNVTLVEERSTVPDEVCLTEDSAAGGLAVPRQFSTTWKSQELFTVKICDFGFAKALQGFTTRTPVGTSTYAAPEVDLDRSKGSQTVEVAADYDAFKADAYSVGVMMFVMLCLAFPAKDGTEGSHRSHKLWPKISADARSLIDGLLEFDPTRRSSLHQVCQHIWVQALQTVEPDSPKSITRRRSKQAVVEEADREWETSRRSPEPRWRCDEDPVLPGVLALHRGLVHIQQERSMALWALTGAPGLDGISSCWDQFQWHIELTQKRNHEARHLLSTSAKDSRFCLGAQLDESFHELASNLTRGRQLSLGSTPVGSEAVHDKEVSPPLSIDSFDAVFEAYSDAARVIIELIARCVEGAKPGSSEGRRAARRYRLFSSAAEQLSRERAFICGHGRLTLKDSNSPKHEKTGLSREMLQRLSEIIGSRKILLGTALSVCYTVATPTGLLGGMVGEGEPALLSTGDIAELEALEALVLAPNLNEALPTEEWYRTLTRLLNEIHSRIAISLVDDMRAPELNLPAAFESEGAFASLITETRRIPSDKPAKVAPGLCGCRAGLRKFLQLLIDRV